MWVRMAGCEANLIGALPAEAALASHPAIRTHIYGKDAKPGRKLGHANVLVDACAGGLEEANGLADLLIASNVYAD